MSSAPKNNAGKNIISILAALITMIIAAAAIQPVYSIDIEYKLDPAVDELIEDEDIINTVFVTQEISKLSDNEKSEFLAPYLTDDQPYKLYADIPSETEYKTSLYTGKEDSVSMSDVKSGNTVTVSQKKHISDEALEYSYQGVKKESESEDNKSDGDTFKFSIQVKSYSQKTSADDLVRQLKKENYESFSVEKYNPSTKEILYRVFVGKYSDFQSAKASCELLRKKARFTDNIFVVNKSWINNDL